MTKVDEFGYPIEETDEDDEDMVEGTDEDYPMPDDDEDDEIDGGADESVDSAAPASNPAAVLAPEKYLTILSILCTHLRRYLDWKPQDFKDTLIGVFYVNTIYKNSKGVETLRYFNNEEDNIFAEFLFDVMPEMKALCSNQNAKVAEACNIYDMGEACIRCSTGCPVVSERRDTLTKHFANALSLVFWSEIAKRCKDLEKLKETCKSLDKNGKWTFVGLGKEVLSFPVTMFDSMAEDGSVLDYLNAVAEAGNAFQVLMEHTPKKQEDVKEVEKAEKASKIKDMSVIDSLVADILNIYSGLYAPCFSSKPLGVLTSDGIMTLNEQGVPEMITYGATYASRLYEVISRVTKGTIPERCDNGRMLNAQSRDSLLQYKYYPLYHLLNILGEDRGNSWSAFKKRISAKLHDLFIDMFCDYEGDVVALQRSVREAFSNCIIISQFDNTKALRMTIYAKGYGSGIADAITRDKAYIFGKDETAGKVLKNEVSEYGVLSYMLVLDVAKYDEELLFAYKAYARLKESGVKPSVSSVILGRLVDGQDKIVNFDADSMVLTDILAGTRSGKGTMTLNILASLYASDCPVFYLDYKPDMAGALWDMERKFSASGINCKIFAIDALRNRTKLGSTPVRAFPYGLNKPEYVPLAGADFAAIPYIKSLQMAFVLAQYRASGTLSSDHRMFMILDECEQFSTSALNSLLVHMESYSKNREKTEEAQALRKYGAKVFTAYGADLESNMNTSLNTTCGTGRVSFLLLGQDSNHASWKAPATHFSELMLQKSKYKILGKNSGTIGGYGFSADDPLVSTFIENPACFGYWTCFGGAKPPKPIKEVIKSYVVLNENDFNPELYALRESPDPAVNSKWKNGFAGSLLNGPTMNESKRQRVIDEDLLNVDRTVREQVGFAGLMKFISDCSDAELAAKLSKGYELAEQFMKMTGLAQRYSCVEEYLFDCSLESIYTINELVSLIDNPSEAPVVSATQPSVESGVIDAPARGMFGENVPPQPDSLTPGVSEQGQQPGVSDEDDDDDFDTMPEESAESAEAEGGAPENRGSERPEGFYGAAPESSAKDTPNGKAGGRTGAGSGSFAGGASSPVNARTAYKKAYSEPLVIADNPFKAYGQGDTLVPSVMCWKEMSNIIKKEIARVYGGLSRITTVAVTASGALVFNGVVFAPVLDEEFIESLPYVDRDKVRNGNLVEFFNFNTLYDFKNIQELVVESPEVAEGRVRREMGIKPRQDFDILFKYFRSLRGLRMGDSEFVRGEGKATAKKQGGNDGFKLSQMLKEKFHMGNDGGPDPTSDSRMSRVWQSKPVRYATSALGWTVGIKAVTLAATLLGPWGLLFGAFAVGNAVVDARHNGGMGASGGSGRQRK